MKHEITFTGRIDKDGFGATTELVTATAHSFKDIYTQLLEQVEDPKAMRTLKENEELVRKYYRNEMTDLAYMNIINESCKTLTTDDETRWGNWSAVIDGETQYLRTINKETGEMTFWKGDKTPMTREGQEYLGFHDTEQWGRTYTPDYNKERELYYEGRKVDYTTLSYDEQNNWNSLIDEFEEGWNGLEEDGKHTYEVMNAGLYKIRRRVMAVEEK